MIPDPRHAVHAISETFQTAFRRLPTAITYAPGRIEVIGNHTDYNGGPVIGAAIDRGVWVAVASRDDGLACLRTTQPASAPVELPLNIIPVPRQAADSAWVNYPLGVIEALGHFSLRRPVGFDYLAVSDLPAGSGLSSSAAIELASALAFLQLTGQSCPPLQLAMIGRHAENNFIGVPCGILDQGVSAHGRAGHLVLIDCAALALKALPLPAGVEFWVFNTHTKHALVDGLYATRHRECMGAAVALGVSQLADVDATRLARDAAKLTTEQLARAKHVVSEITRVHEMVAALQICDLRTVGRLLAQSHDSSRRNFLNSTPELDFLVDRLLPMSGVHGARLTGGGFGGAVLALTTAEFSLESADAISHAYAEHFGGHLEVLRLQPGGGAQVLVS
jgi:galactokinase